MATIIRSAQISDEAVTLVVQARAITETRPPNSARAMPLTEQKEPVHEAALEKSRQQSTQEQKAHDSLLNEIQKRESLLEERERLLNERERLLNEQMAGESRKVLEEAYAEGYKNGEHEGAMLYQERLAALQKLIDTAKEQFAGDIAGLEDMIVSIVFEAICKIIGTSLHNHEGVLAMVREVMNRAKDQEKLVLRVSPQDYELLDQHRAKLFGERSGLRHEIVPDDRVALGGCLIETLGGTIDGRLDSQLQLLRDTLISARKMIPE
jgi:flagellar assembly protein FliH